ncbi:MAG: single-stranded DNA-binding protein [Oscillatoria sp. SIO1A7]|nr:single-stranded DNA-binding protein [Oscillatoria sp. SIO1A7]
MSLNAIHLVGRAGRDPEIKYLSSGKAVCNLTLAVNRRSKNDQPDWFDLEFWDRTAEIAHNYVRKGNLIGIQGSLKFDRWTDRSTGAPRSKPVIRVERLDLLGSKKDAEQARQEYSQGGGDYNYDEF